MAITQTDLMLAMMVGTTLPAPKITVRDLKRDDPARLIVWGRKNQVWYGGICTAVADETLVTWWAQAKAIQKIGGQDYSRVLRITLASEAASWPIVPPVMMHNGFAHLDAFEHHRLDDSMPIGHTHRTLIQRINTSRLR